MKQISVGTEEQVKIMIIKYVRGGPSENTANYKISSDYLMIISLSVKASDY